MTFVLEILINLNSFCVNLVTTRQSFLLRLFHVGKNMPTRKSYNRFHFGKNGIRVVNFQKIVFSKYSIKLSVVNRLPPFKNFSDQTNRFLTE